MQLQMLEIAHPVSGNIQPISANQHARHPLIPLHSHILTPKSDYSANLPQIEKQSCKASCKFAACPDPANPSRHYYYWGTGPENRYRNFGRTFPSFSWPSWIATCILPPQLQILNQFTAI
jgi:hypothetical protein